MNKIKKLFDAESNGVINTILILVMLIPMIAVFVMTGYSVFDKKTVSTRENRNLATAPVLSLKNIGSGIFMSQTESFLGDHVYARDKIVAEAANLEEYLKKDLTMTVTKSADRQKEIGSDYIVKDDRIVALFVPDKEYTKDFVKYSKKIYSMLPEGINKYMVLEPLRVEFEEEDIKQYSASQKDYIDYFYDCAPEDVTTIGCYDQVEKAVEAFGINEIYYRTDHHWTHLGSYFAANAILEGMGSEAIDIMNYEKIDQGDIFRGYMVTMHEKETYNIKSDDFTYFTVGTNRTEKVYDGDDLDTIVPIEGNVVDPDRYGYYTFVGKSYQYAVLDGGNPNGDNLLIIMDSYTNSTATWLNERFNKIVLVDPRYYTGGKNGLMELVEKYEINDFSINVGVASCCGSYSEQLGELCK